MTCAGPGSPWPVRMAPGRTSSNSARTPRARAATPSTSTPRSRGRPSAPRWRSSRCSATSAASSSGCRWRLQRKKKTPARLVAPGALLYPLLQHPGKLSPFQEIRSGGGGNRTHRPVACPPLMLRPGNAQVARLICSTHPQQIVPQGGAGAIFSPKGARPHTLWPLKPPCQACGPRGASGISSARA
jgi:hypothetical protein